MSLQNTLLLTCLGLAIPLRLFGQVTNPVSDFNGDGYADLAIGVPNEVVGDKGNAGAVNVIYGSATGLVAAGSQLWHQDVQGIRETAQVNDWFGSALATGDFNGDGFSDLAIGVPGEGGGYPWGSGGVNVLYGSASGLTSRGNRFWSQDSPGVLGTAEAGDLFGFSLAAGDFNGDSYTDLAIGVPGEDIGGVPGAGGVNVLYGSANGLTSSGNQVWLQDSEGIAGVAEAYDSFGHSLAAANFGKSSHDDLAIGVPGEAIGGGVNDAGAVNVIYGSDGGLTAAGDQLWHQDSPGIRGGVESVDRFGTSLAAGNLGGSWHADLAIGVPYEHTGVLNNESGAVNVIYGSAAGLTAAGNQVLAVDYSDYSYFGSSLAVGNFNGGEYAQLAVGAPSYKLSDSADGAVFIWDCSGDAWIMHTLLPFDSGTHFGWSLSAANFGGRAAGSYDDLAVGAPLTQVNGQPNAGAVRVFYGSRSGLDQSQFWSQDSPDIPGVAEPGDRFGDTLPGRKP